MQLLLFAKQPETTWPNKEASLAPVATETASITPNELGWCLVRSGKLIDCSLDVELTNVLL